jgi:hypothetical protein
MWLLSVDKIPELIEGGDQGANETVRRLKEKTEQVRNLATVLAGITNEAST